MPAPALGSKLKTTVKLAPTGETPQNEPTKTAEIAPTLTAERPFTFEQLQKAWAEFAQMREQNGGAVSEQVMLNRTIVCEGTTIKLVLDNLHQEQLLNEVKPDLLGYLRHQLQNRLLQISYQIAQSDAKRNPYTPQEKFNALIEKNPHLAQLQQRLGLEVDF
jgi:DNA polymerase-3 subunit gamma/tau